MTAKKSLLNLLVGSAVVLAAPSVFSEEKKPGAPPTSGWYAAAIGGLGWLDKSQIEGAGTGSATYQSGFAAGVSGGYDFGRWRLATEYLYQTNDADSLNLTSNGAGLGTGSLEGLSGGDFSSVVVSANVIGDFNLLGSDRAESYVGVGLAWLQEVDIDINTDAGQQSFSTDDFGFQVFAGLDYRLSPRWSASLEARYLSAGNLDLEAEGGTTPSTLKADYDRTSVLLGLRYKF